MNVLQQIRASLAPQGAPMPQPVPTATPQPAGAIGAIAPPAGAIVGPSGATAPPVAPCPFTFGPWLPRTDPGAHQGEGQCAVMRNGHLVGWWRREWIIPPEMAGDPPEALSRPFGSHAIYSPTGELLLASLHQQAMLEALAERP